MTMETLKFGTGNAKLVGIFTFSLPSGHTCPFADKCLSMADRITGKITDGPNAEFRCFSASQEALFKHVRANRWHNYDLLKDKSMSEMYELIQTSLPTRRGIVRIHVGGDFFNKAYFQAWVQVAKMNKHVIFYAYTKSVPFWTQQLTEIPDNFILTASQGGKKDNMIKQYKLKSAVVVKNEEEAAAMGLEVDYDDKKAYENDESFALVIHGTQAKGSAMGKAITDNRKNGKHAGYGGSYPKKKVQRVELTLN